MAAGSIRIGAGGEWTLAAGEAASVVWSTPPEALGKVMRALFEAQPPDVLFWLHDAVWRLHAEALMVAPEASLGCCPGVAAVAADTQLPVPSVSGVSGRSQSKSLAMGGELPLLLSSKDVASPQQSASSSSWAHQHMAGGISSLRRARSPDRSVPPELEWLSSKSSAAGEAASCTKSPSSNQDFAEQIGAFMSNFRTDKSLSIETVSRPPMCSTPTNRCRLHSVQRLWRDRRTVRDHVFVLAFIVDIWSWSFWAAFRPATGAPTWSMVLQIVLACFFCLDAVLNSIMELLQDGLGSCRRPRFWADIVAVAADVASLWLFPSLQVVKVLVFLRVLRLTRIRQYAAPWLRCAVMWLDLEVPANVMLVHAALLLLAHTHAAASGALQLAKGGPPDAHEAFWDYAQSLLWAYAALTFGAAPGASDWGEQLLGLALCLARTTLLLLGGLWLLQLAAHRGWEEEAADAAACRRALVYLRSRHASPRLGARVFRCLRDAASARQREARSQVLAAPELSEQLRMKACTELWEARLTSLGILRDVLEKCPLLKASLCKSVREAVLPPGRVLFSAGEHSTMAFLVIRGTLGVQLAGTGTIEATPDLTEGMWTGEQAIVNPELLRMETVTCKTQAELMVVPAVEFHRLIVDHGFAEEFKAIVVGKLWRGLCGRCGAFGEHFSKDCPGKRRSRRSTSPQQAYRPATSRRSLSGGLFRHDPRQVMPQAAMDKDLQLFLDEKRLVHLMGPMQRCGIHSLDDINEPAVRALLQDEEVELRPGQLELLSGEVVGKFRATIQKNVSKLISQSNREGCFIFISHYKVEAGTEASLMQSGIDALLQQHPSLGNPDVARPVFVDTEDLRDLSELKEHVRTSQNLIILLTPGILRRPWCLVEITTAVNANLRLVPVEIQRKEMTFDYPDDAYFERLRMGKELDEGAEKLLLSEGVDLNSLERALRQVFKRIALPYSPHKTASIREAELKDILKLCRTREAPSRSRER